MTMYEQERMIFEQKPLFGVWQPELGHLPYAAMRFEKQEDTEDGLDFIVTVGGGFPTDLKDVAGFLRDVADMLEEAIEMDLAEESAENEDPDEDEDPPNWMGGPNGFI
jgi:hypothetical protein